MTPATARGSKRSRLADALAPVAPIAADEVGAALLSFAYFFCVLCSYYILRPLRDEMGVSVGRDGLQWLFIIVFFVMLGAVPLFGWVVSRFERRRIAPIVYGFFICNLIAFRLLLGSGQNSFAVASAFFVFVSVFNLFVVSLFWSVMSDLWSSEQAKRLYGFIAAGGSAGAMAGPGITQTLVHSLGAANLLLISAAILAVAIVCLAGLRDSATARRPASTREPSGHGGLLAGALHVMRSSYLAKIAVWVLIANLVSTFFYFEQARIVGASIADRADRVQLFARMDLAGNVLTALAQLFLTSRLLRAIGVGPSAGVLSISAVAGLTALAVAPTLAVIVTIIVVERSIAFAISNPAVRVLYTVVTPEDKYKAQNFIDTVVFRGGDAASGWLLNGVGKLLGASSSTVAALTIPFACAWLAISLVLGREQSARSETVAAAQAPAQ